METRLPAPSSEPVRVGLVGFGYASATFHAPLLSAHPRFEIAAVVSSDPARVHAALPDVQVWPGPEALLADRTVEMVVVATPNDTHAPLAEAALRAGRHVVVEKPMTLTAAEAERLDALARSRGLVLSAFHNRRWDGDFRTLQHLVGTGALGEVRELWSHFDRFRPAVRDRWRERDVPGGGILYDLGSHLIDQALVLFGTPDAVWADVLAQRHGASTDDAAHVVLRYGARRVHLHAAMLVAAPPVRFAAHGTAGSYVVRGLDPQEDALKAGAVPGGPDWGTVAPGAYGVLTQGDTAHPVPTLPGDYPAYLTALARAIRDGGPVPVPAAEAALVLRVIEAAQRSSRERREVAWG